MTSDIKLNLDAMLGVYDSLLSKWRDAILKGNPVPQTARKMAHLDGCAALSEFKVTKDNYHNEKIVSRRINNQVHDKRNELLLGLLYDRLISTPETTLEQILEKVRDPLLDAATMWLAAHGGIRSTTQGKFVQNFDPLKDVVQDESTSQDSPNYSTNRILSFYLRSIMLLEIAVNHSETIALLEEDSSYFLHRLFKKKRFTIPEIESEIAEIIPDFFSESLLSALQRADEFIQPSQEGVIKRVRLGRYILPSNLPVSFVKQGAEAESEFRELYNRAETKREIYTTLAEVSVLISKEVVNKYGSSTPLKKTSSFSIGDSAYATIQRIIRTYATNQLFGLWKESNIPNYCPETPLSYLMFLKTEIQGERLAITDKRAKRPSTLYLTKDSMFLDTSRELPFCVYILNKYYKTAMEINAQNNASAKQETQ